MHVKKLYDNQNATTVGDLVAANDSFLFLREEIRSVLNQDTTQNSSLEQERVLALRTQPAGEETKVLTERNTINMVKTSNMEEEKDELVGGERGSSVRYEVSFKW